MDSYGSRVQRRDQIRPSEHDNATIYKEYNRKKTGSVVAERESRTFHSFQSKNTLSRRLETMKMEHHFHQSGLCNSEDQPAP